MIDESGEDYIFVADRFHIVELPLDDEIEEAEARRRELDEDPSKAISLEQLDEMVANRPR